MNQLKKILLFLLGVFFLSACSVSNSQEDTQSNTDTSVEEEATVLYTATIKEVDEGRILVQDMNPVETEDIPGFDEVVLLMNEDIPLTNKTTGEDIQIEDLKEGDNLEVVLIENAPTTMSLPPQLPGMSIVQVELVE